MILPEHVGKLTGFQCKPNQYVPSTYDVIVHTDKGSYVGMTCEAGPGDMTALEVAEMFITYEVIPAMWFNNPHKAN